ncbi:MAG: hypothetical protein AAFR66_01185 [Bacteroidota bacterium]
MSFHEIVEAAWNTYDPSRPIQRIADISAKVSTNHVYRIKLEDGASVIAKLSYFGEYKHFVEDHSIINTLSNNLEAPFDNVLATSLMKGGRLFVYRHKKGKEDVWVVFYRPIKVMKQLPRRLEEEHVEKMACQFAAFHQACTTIRHSLPPSSKSMKTDIVELEEYCRTGQGKDHFGEHTALIIEHCRRFMYFYKNYIKRDIPVIPVFVDWNIGNFSVSKNLKLVARWDYDWFRMSSRIADFYFLARVVSDVGDRTVFTYNIDVLKEERFLLFLRKYHEKFPLKTYEIDMIPEMYRFFLLNYVLKLGRFFFREDYANKLQAEVIEHHLPSIKHFETDQLKETLFSQTPQV